MCDNVQVASKNINNVGRLFSKLKDRKPLSEATDVVYQFKCNDCGRFCIGTTGQKIKKRGQQHANDVLNNNPARSALARHSIENNHSFDFENVRILETERKYNKRMFLEELHIKSCKNCVNIKSIESKNVSGIYTKLLEKCAK